MLYLYKQLQHLTDAKMDLVKSDAKDIIYSFLLVNNADRKRYEDLQTEMMNLYTQNRNIYRDGREENDQQLHSQVCSQQL